MLLTIQKAAEHVGVSRETLRRLEKDGKIAPCRDRNGWRRFAATDLVAAREVLGLPSDGTNGSTLTELRDELRRLEEKINPKNFDPVLSRRLDAVIQKIEALTENGADRPD